MAGRIAGITIEIGGDTSNLQKSLKGVDSELKKTQSNLKDVNKLLKLDPGNVELLSQKQRQLSDAISGTEEKLRTLKDAAKDAEQQLADGKEQLESKNYSYQGEVEQRLVCNRTICKSVTLLNQFFDYHPNCEETSGKEHQDACESEEMHRLLSECTEEPQ